MDIDFFLSKNNNSFYKLYNFIMKQINFDNIKIKCSIFGTTYLYKYK